MNHNIKQKMKTEKSIVQQYHPYLFKVTSLPSFQPLGVSDKNLSVPTSSSSCQSQEISYWKDITEWILKFRKSQKISNSTLYLAISFLLKINRFGFNITTQNYEKIGVSLLLLSAKMNEIYPPKLKHLFSKCKRSYQQEEIIEIQGIILKFFQYNMSFHETSYSQLAQLLVNQKGQMMKNGEKLLALSIKDREIIKSGEQTLAYAIVYLIQPEIVKKMGKQNMTRIKSVANKVYRNYMQKKSCKI